MVVGSGIWRCIHHAEYDVGINCAILKFAVTLKLKQILKIYSLTTLELEVISFLTKIQLCCLYPHREKVNNTKKSNLICCYIITQTASISIVL